VTDYLATIRAEWERTPSPILRNDMDWLHSAPSVPLCAAGDAVVLPRQRSHGTETIRKDWRGLVVTMAMIDAAFLIVFALAWVLAR